MLFADLVNVSAALTATPSRLRKRDLLADMLAGTPADEIEIAVAYLSGELRQRRTGVGWAALRSLPAPATEPTLELWEVDAALEDIASIAGPGSAALRSAAVEALFGRATQAEQDFLRGLMSGGVRQGALDAAILDAVAQASGVPLPDIRRAAMLRGRTGPVAVAALTSGPDAVRSFGMQVGQPVRPMLASSAPDVVSALEKIGSGVSIDVKLDGIRIQAHRLGDQVSLFTRSLEDITERLPEVVAIVRRSHGHASILDGEVISIGRDGRPRPFQETASRTASQLDEAAVLSDVTPFFFDILHLDGRDLIDLPLEERLVTLDSVVPGAYLIPRASRPSVEAAAEFFSHAIATGQEGVVVKALDAGYEAGRRGADWIKVKPRHTLDLVVLAVEWGSGRRQGWLSNIHLGARDPSGGFVMLGKTFKGMTDEMLRWQTTRFTELAVDPDTIHDGYVVKLRPEQVVEVAFDGVQRSTRYPGGVALRFARVLRYRDDKPAAEADTIETVRTFG